MKNSLKYLLILLLAQHAFFLKAQEDSVETIPVDSSLLNYEEIEPRQRVYYQYSPRLTFTVPNPIANSAFNKTFVGVYELSAGLNLMFRKGFYAGVEVKNGLFKVTQKKIPNYNASMSVYCAAAKIGTDFYMNEKNTILMSMSFAAGQNVTKFYSLVSKTPGKQPEINSFKTPYVEPELNIYLFTEENFGFGFTVSYTLMTRTFNPYELSLNDWTSYSKTNTGATQYLNFGFGLYWGLVQK